VQDNDLPGNYRADRKSTVEEQDDLFELIRKRRVEQRRTEIAVKGERLRQAVKMGTAQQFDRVEDLKSYLFADDEVY
jgi:hypothetical protein